MSQSPDIASQPQGAIEHVPVVTRSAIELLRSWRNANDEDAQEQRETLDFLIKALDEDRPSLRKLFP